MAAVHPDYTLFTRVMFSIRVNITMPWGAILKLHTNILETATKYGYQLLKNYEKKKCNFFVIKNSKPGTFLKAICLLK